LFFKSFGLDANPVFDFKDCSEDLVPIVEHIFNLRLSQQYFPTPWKQVGLLHVFKKGDNTLIINYTSLYFS
jgi:hypothetical protein